MSFYVWVVLFSERAALLLAAELIRRGCTVGPSGSTRQLIEPGPFSVVAALNLEIPDALISGGTEGASSTNMASRVVSAAVKACGLLHHGLIVTVKVPQVTWLGSNIPSEALPAPVKPKTDMERLISDDESPLFERR